LDWCGEKIAEKQKNENTFPFYADGKQKLNVILFSFDFIFGVLV
jgi:hypothetical protein